MWVPAEVRVEVCVKSAKPFCWSSRSHTATGLRDGQSLSGSITRGCLCVAVQLSNTLGGQEVLKVTEFHAEQTEFDAFRELIYQRNFKEVKLSCSANVSAAIGS